MFRKVVVPMNRASGLVLAVLGVAVVSCGGSSGTASNTGTGDVAQGDHGNSSSSSTTTAPASSPASTTTSTASSTAAAGATSGGGSPATSAPKPSGTSVPATTAVAAPRSGTPSTPAPAGGTTQAPAGPWTLKVYYTAVESFHNGAPQAVTGCDLNADECDNGTTPLGSYPSDFVALVKDNGYGRITSGKYAGKYLAWDPQGGWSIEPTASDANGNALQPFVSAASDLSITIGTHFKVLDCGTDSTTHQPPDAGACGRLTAPDWVVTDNSTQPYGSHEIDLYVGEENQPDFENTVPYVIATTGARTSLK
jgi:hypothetical protein